MNLEGSLDAFGLPDVFALLASTGKSGALALRRAQPSGGPIEGVVWFRGGLLSAASSDRARASLVRRIVGSGAVDDTALRQAVARAAGGVGLARALLEAGAVEPELLRQAATDQVVDAVFDLLRWPDGEFGFDQTAVDPDDVGIALDHGKVLAEATARAESWEQLAALVPGQDSVLAVPVVLHHEPEVTRDEWALLALVDGRRRVRDLVELTGCGQFAVTTTLAHLVQRGLLHVKDAAAPDHVAVVERRFALLSGVESSAVVAPVPQPEHHREPELEHVMTTRTTAGPGSQGMSAAAALVAARAAQHLDSRPAARREVVPPRPEPFLPGRRPEHPEPVEAAPVAGSGSRFTGRTATPVPASYPAPAPPAFSGSLSGAHGAVEGATARALSDPSAQREPVADGVIERDPGINRSLLLRLIAGVRGL